MISTAGDGALSVADPSSNATGRLVNGTFSLPPPLQAAATSPAGTGGALAAGRRLGGADLAADLRRPDLATIAVTLDFRQRINANDALRTGAYSKTLTFTLSTNTTPIGSSMLGTERRHRARADGAGRRGLRREEGREGSSSKGP